MNKVQIKSWQQARAELARVAPQEDCLRFDQALASGRKVSAVRLLRTFGISIYGDDPPNGSF